MALTRAQQICFIMGPLDMRGLVGAATIMNCLKYGACFSGLDDQDDPVFLHLVCEFPWQNNFAWWLGLCVGVACLCFVCGFGWFLASREI